MGVHKTGLRDQTTAKTVKLARPIRVVASYMTKERALLEQVRVNGVVVVTR